MYQRQHNKTAVLSQKMIVQALHHLMKRKPFHKISITEICEEAGVGRKTFYRNFELKEDVLDFYLDELCGEFSAKFKDQPPEEMLNLYFSFISDHADFFILLYKNGLMDLAHHKFEVFIPMMMPVWAENTLEQAYRSQFVIAGIEAILRFWIQREFSESIEEVVEFSGKALERQIMAEN